MSDPRDTFLERVVNGHTFADVGGLWGTVSEKVSVAKSFGATDLTMIDIQPADNQYWRLFHERMQQRGIQNVRSISRNILDTATDPSQDTYDVVHCSGVLYHLPDPLRLVEALRNITREHLVLTSAITAERVKNEHGTLEIPTSGALFVPALSGRERAILRAHWSKSLGEGAIGLTTDFSAWDTENFGPWWWLPTRQTLRSMCATAGFNVLDDALFWNDNFLVLFLRRQGVAA
jgi:hypothetical protein